MPSQPERSVLASLRRHGQEAQYDKSLSLHSRSELSKILGCRDGPFGSHEFQCRGCGHRRVVYASCNNRHCPSCTWIKRKAWLDVVLQWQLPCEYYHTVFTVPHTLNRLLLANQKECYLLFFHTAQKTLLHAAKESFGCQPGMILALHTWGQRMLPHIHIHAIMTAGGVSIQPKQSSNQPSDETPLEPKSWIPIPPDAPEMMNDVLAMEFRKRFVRGLKLLYKKGLLVIPEERAGATAIQSQSEFDEWLDQIASKPWVVDAQRSLKYFRNIYFLIKYCGNYVIGIAISDYRILSDENGMVTISYKDYKRKIRTTETMEGKEFVRRFMLHIVPRGVHRVRYGGFFHGKGRTARLDECRKLQNEYNDKNNIHYYSSQTPESTPTTGATLVAPPPTPPIIERNLPTCARCKTLEMVSLGFQDSRTTQAIIATIRHVVALYATSWTTLENWSEYFLKNIQTKKLQEGIFQSWFDFDRKVPIEVIYQLSDSVTRITICPEYPALLRHQLPIPDW